MYVVSPELTEWMDEAAAAGKITAVRRNYTPTDLENAFLVIGATDNDRVNRRVAEECLERNVLVNIADDTAKCNFIVPAVLRQGPLSISISTDGKSPMLARRIREELEPSFGPEYREFLDLMGDIREHVIQNVPEEDKRKDVFRRLVYSDIIELLREGQHEKVKERISHVLGSGWTQS
ncbi:MAG: bifunctional precorrin-2 dehydrogenase/sirohydrochlorin ferrochelatase [Firmicutes bacterium]|nr:bifunctional precorrin-2 dehydrogenase/sirohydrochlorin ferrochelatase [Bacillota bacterium]